MTIISPARARGRRARRTLLAGVLAACALPAAADAAEIDRPIGGPNQLRVDAAAGEANRLRVSDDGPGFVRIRDEVALRESTNICTAISSFEARCSVTPATVLLIRLGDRDDRIEVASSVRAGIDGEAGDDTYAAAWPSPAATSCSSAGRAWTPQASRARPRAWT